MVNLLPIVQAYAHYAKASFVRKTRQPLETQSQFLQKLLRVQQDTELGKTFGLSEIRSIDQFRERVPILPYSSYEPYTDRVALGEPNVLNADPVIYINLTSGSTGKQKMVPVTQRFKASLNKSNATALGFFLEVFPRYAAQYPDRRLEFGKIVSTNAIRLQGRTAGGVEYGPVTAGSFRMNRWLCQQAFAQPLDAMELGDGVSRHYLCLLFSLVNPQVRGIVANFPMLMLRTCQYLNKYAESLIQDIATGQFADWLTIEPALKASLMRQWRPNPQRAAELRQVLEIEGKLTPRNAWKQLSLIGTALGGTSDFYLKRFPEYFGDLPVFGGVYGTAEANFGVCYELNQEGCILAIESGFYEFVPPDQWEESQPKTLLPSEVKVGEQYRILLSSYSGFYRYDIGDVVEVTGFFERTPIIVFRHRHGGLLSSTTEKTTEYHLTQTMRALQQEFGMLLDDFCVTLSAQEFPAHYLVNIELATGQTLADPAAFLMRFDALLGEFNDQYRMVRQDAVPVPRLRLLAPGSFTIVKQRLLQRGTSDSQLKLPHLSEDREFLADVTVEQEIRLPMDVALRG
ncbi:MAG: GH3 auxin-responsive promoter family protein [Pegethrix bostrychoides GSE-TBD4-15B]|jgi:hypothetical protein|uniref:GH3 auxin-responsive promoter family protein n=1 Tax=Pegethrix bostrychoides GSE-TBD4-15B TaxID=2839662 RepID=A0A951U4F9_9CYAN|nr:GH3 auxin-responsive promoter family protein [Pegethrix bostrychoides GSE-TBD4-15B]